MTLIGKIFTVLIFVMSLMFMTLSLMVIATHKNWKDEAGRLQATIKDRQAEITRLTDDRKSVDDKLARELVARKTALASLQSKLNDLQQNLTSKETELADKTALSVKVASELERAQSTLAEVQREVQTLRGDLQKAMEDRDAQLTRVVDLTTTLHNTEQDLRVATERNEQLTAIRADLTALLESNGIEPENPTGDPPPNRVALIDTVNGSGLIQFRLGFDDGIRENQTLQVIDDSRSRYLGEVTVTRTEPNFAVGRFEPKDRATKVKRGDYVSTRLR